MNGGSMARRGLIAIAGIVGVGKTTLAENLAAALQAELVLEEYDQNPFLADEVQGKREAGLPTELFFLFSRVRQLHRDRIASEANVVCDYVFRKNRIFAEMYLDAEEYAVYRRLEELVELYMAPANVVIYLQGELEICLDRIARRGRSFEKAISVEFLKQLHEAYERLFDDWQQCPVIRIDASQYDFRQEQDVRQILSRLDDRICP
jgi:deoxyadenosine/deoxycytidine kinase